MPPGFILGINAARAGSGGAVAHLKGILSAAVMCDTNVEAIHVWCPKALVGVLPKDSRFNYHSPEMINGSLLSSILWERFKLPSELKGKNCAALLNVDAGSFCRFWPSVSMSRDMLSFEPKEMARYNFSRSG